MREAYDYFHDPDNKRLGQNFWTAICMLITELLIDFKYGNVGSQKVVKGMHELSLLLNAI